MQRRALVAIDEPGTSVLIERALLSAGMEALTVPQNADAEILLQAERFELVFLDYHAPPRDGAEPVRRLRNLPAHHATPIVLISDDINPHAMAMGFAAGASFFLYKPIESRCVILLVRATQGAVENERRRLRRVPVRLKVFLNNDRKELQGETLDISMNGLLVQAPSTFPVGSSVEVRLYLSMGDRPLSCSGCVVRQPGHSRMGIQLGHLRPSECEKLQDFLLPLIRAD
jgi:DNA-binding response OmpR family regulator